MRYRWAVLAAGTAAQASLSALLAGVPILAPALRDEFDLSIPQIGVAMASLWVGPILTLLPWGLLADRIGERFVLSVGLAACGALVVAAGFSDDFETLVLLLFVSGAVGASVNAASGRAVMQWFPVEERGLALGIRQTAIPIGVGLAALVVPFAEQAGGLEAGFGYLGTMCVAGSIVALAVIREPPVRDAELEGDAVPWTLRDGRIWTLSVGSGLYLFAQIALMSFVVLFLHDVHGLSESQAGAVLALMQAGAIGTRIGAGRLSDRLGSRLRPLRWTGLASAAGLLVTALVAESGVGLVIAAVVVAGAISMGWNGLSVTAAAELAGRARSGAAIGFQQTVLSVVGVGMPVLFAALVESTSWRTAFALSATGPLVGWLMLGRLRERV